jgi:hypothetical protein
MHRRLVGFSVPIILNAVITCKDTKGSRKRHNAQAHTPPTPREKRMKLVRKTATSKNRDVGCGRVQRLVRWLLPSPTTTYSIPRSCVRRTVSGLLELLGPGTPPTPRSVLSWGSGVVVPPPFLALGGAVVTVLFVAAFIC